VFGRLTRGYQGSDGLKAGTSWISNLAPLAAAASLSSVGRRRGMDRRLARNAEGSRREGGGGDL